MKYVFVSVLTSLVWASFQTNGGLQIPGRIVTVSIPFPNGFDQVAQLLSVTGFSSQDAFAELYYSTLHPLLTLYIGLTSGFK